MITFDRFILDNGLRLLVIEDESTPLVTVNMLYDVGSKDERPDCTGFAHLFEHLMFGGSANAPSFDDPIQRAGGECNAFTNADLTNFFSVLPATNLELALFLEADRMSGLTLNERSLAVQREVVTEEFKETSLNQPYGDMWHLLAPLAYTRHPYRWPTIGSEIEHIARAELDDVGAFYQNFYGPDNAICVIAGNVSSPKALELVKAQFGDIPPRSRPSRSLPAEPPQSGLRRIDHATDVPAEALYMAFHMSSRTDRYYYAEDLLSDVLGSGKSSRLYDALAKEQELCSHIDAYITGTIEPGLLIIEANPADWVENEVVEAAIWKVLEEASVRRVTPRELQRHQNKIESSILFSNTSALNKALNLAYFELIHEPDLINTEHLAYQMVTPAEIQRAAARVLTRENCSVLTYRPLATPKGSGMDVGQQN